MVRLLSFCHIYAIKTKIKYTKCLVSIRIILNTDFHEDKAKPKKIKMLKFINIIPCILILTIIIQMDGDKMQVFSLQHGRNNCEIKNMKNIRVFDTVIHPEYKWDVLMSNISRDHLVVILSTNSFPIAYDSRIHGSITVLWRAYEYAASSLTMAIEAFCMENNYSLGTNFPGME